MIEIKVSEGGWKNVITKLLIGGDVTKYCPCCRTEIEQDQVGINVDIQTFGKGKKLRKQRKVLVSSRIGTQDAINVITV